MSTNIAKFSIGEVVKHRHFDFRGVIYDVDFEFNNSEESSEPVKHPLIEEIFVGKKGASYLKPSN